MGITTFLRRSRVDMRQAGSFLGEAFSLSSNIRLEFMNTVRLHNTGVVLALTRMFSTLQLPNDLQKINRLVHGVALIWWRQHEHMESEFPEKVRESNDSSQDISKISEVVELSGLELKRNFRDSDALHQLMFSTIMLHWYIHRDGTCSRKINMNFLDWKKINQGIGFKGDDMRDLVVEPIFNLISRNFFPELAIPDSEGGDGKTKPNERSCQVLSSAASLEGWAEIIGGGFPRATGLTAARTMTYQHLSSIFSESTTSSRTTSSPLSFNALSRDGLMSRAKIVSVDVASSRVRTDDLTLLSLACGLLFLSASATSVPYAFMDLREVGIARENTDTCVLTLAGASGEGNAVTPEQFSILENNTNSKLAKNKPITIVLLLPDGRWQKLSLEKLELRLASIDDLHEWRSRCDQEQFKD